MSIVVLLLMTYLIFKFLGKAAPWIFLIFLPIWLWTFFAKFFWWIIGTVIILGIFYYIGNYHVDKDGKFATKKHQNSSDDETTSDNSSDLQYNDSSNIEVTTDTNLKNESSYSDTNNSQNFNDYPSITYHPLRRALHDFVVIDIETSGLSYSDKIIQISAVKYISDKETDSFNYYINPDFYISDNIVFLTHITNDLLNKSPYIEEVMPKFHDFIGDLPLIGHNIKFDLKFLTRQGLYKDDISYIDTLPMAQKKLTDIQNCKLPTLKKYFGIVNNSHNALDDCKTTALVYLNLRDNRLDKVEIDKSNIEQNLQGLKFSITGEFMEETRDELIEHITDHGGTVTKSVSKVTDYLLDGTQVSERLADGIHSNTELKAFDIIQDGGKLKILDYKLFDNLLNNKDIKNINDNFINNF